MRVILQKYLNEARPSNS